MTQNADMVGHDAKYIKLSKSQVKYLTLIKKTLITSRNISFEVKFIRPEPFAPYRRLRLKIPQLAAAMILHHESQENPTVS